MARPISFDKNTMLDVIETLFLKSGYDGTGYLDIQAATKLGKGSLYAAFGNKETLFTTILTRYADREIARFTPLLAGGEPFNDLSPQERLHAFLLIPVESARAEHADEEAASGCLLCMMAAAATEKQGLFRQISLTYFSALEKLVAPLLPVEKQSFAAMVIKQYVACQIYIRAGRDLDRLAEETNDLIAVLLE